LQQFIDPLPGHNATAARALNDLGQVVGVTGDAQTARAFVYGNGTMKNLGVLPGSNVSRAYDINNKGQIVGASATSAGDSWAWQAYKPFIYSNGAIKELPSLGRGGTAYSINDYGQVVGQLGNPFGDYLETTAFVYSGGKMIDLNTLPEVISTHNRIQAAIKINNAGQILAYYAYSSNYVLLTPIRPQPNP
jgi:probable HAF family extracellular repeat protein